MRTLVRLGLILAVVASVGNFFGTVVATELAKVVAILAPATF